MYFRLCSVSCTGVVFGRQLLKESLPLRCVRLERQTARWMDFDHARFGRPILLHTADEPTHFADAMLSKPPVNRIRFIPFGATFSKRQTILDHAQPLNVTCRGAKHAGSQNYPRWGWGSWPIGVTADVLVSLGHIEASVLLGSPPWPICSLAAGEFSNQDSTMRMKISCVYPFFFESRKRGLVSLISC